MVKVSAEEYPFSSHFFEIDGYRLHYLDEGPADKPVLLMVHGNPTWSFYYRKLVSAFSKDYRVIVPDHMGCGFSDKPQIYPYQLRKHISNLTKLVKHLDLQNIHLIVHDWGGAIGMGMAVQEPSRISRFVVFNTAAFFLPNVPKRIKMCRIPFLGAFLVRGLNGFSQTALWMATSQRKRFTSSVRQGYIAPYDNWKNRVAIHNFVMDIPLENGHPTRETLDEIEAGLKQFKHLPMLILWGADDFCFTKKDFLPEWEIRFPDAETVVFPHAGHYVVEDAHEQIIPLMKDFFEKK